MKKQFYILVSFGILLLIFPMQAQKVTVNVSPGSGTLNSAITATTDKSNTIFVLERGGIYEMTASVFIAGHIIDIQAAAGDGPRPVISASANRLFFRFDTAPAGLNLKGVHLTLKRPGSGTEAFNFPIRSNAAGSVINIDDCLLDYADQTMFFLASANNKVYISNSIIRNSMRYSAPAGNGHLFHNNTAGTAQGVLSVKNSTIYALSSNILGSSIPMDSLVFDHNIVFFSGFTQNFNVSQAVVAEITNNVFYNYAIRGNVTAHDPFFVASSLGTGGHNGKLDSDRKFDFSNNNIHIQQELRDIILANRVSEQWDIRTNVFFNQSILDTATSEPPFLVTMINNQQVTKNNIFSEPLVFKNAPPLPMEYFTELVKIDFAANSLPAGVQRPFMDEDQSSLVPVTSGAFDFSYNNNAQSATSAADNKPLGPSYWVPFEVVSNLDFSAPLSTFRLFPNPFNEKLTFEMEASGSSLVKIMITDITGKEVFSKIETVQSGLNRITIESSIQKSGIYLYQVLFDSPSAYQIFKGKIIKH